MIRFTGFFALLPATLLLAVSFFVLFAAARTEGESLRRFARVVAGLLWACAGLVILTGVYIVATGDHPVLALLRDVCSSCPAQ